MTNSNDTACVGEVEVADCDVSEFLQYQTQSQWEGPLWTREATLALIEAYRLNRPLVGTESVRRMNQLWEVMSNEVKRVASTYFTPSQCENRWRVLERNFRKCGKNSSPRTRKEFEFKKELEGLVSLEKSKSHIHPEQLLAEVVLAESPESSFIPVKLKGYSEPGPPRNLSEDHDYQSPPSKRRLKMRLPTPAAQVDDRRNEMGHERIKGKEQRQEESLEIQKRILRTLQEANDLHREAVQQMAEHNKQMAEHNAILRKYLEYRMSHSGIHD